MKYMNSLPLFWKVFSSIGLTVVVIVGFQVIYFPSQQIRGLETALERKAESLASVIKPQLAASLDFNDRRGIQEGLLALAQDGDVAYAAFFDSDGSVIAAQGIGIAEAEELQVASRESSFSRTVGDVLLHEQPVLTQGNGRGTLALGLSTANIAEESRDIRLAALGLGIFLIGVAVLLAVFVARAIGRRVQQLAAVAERVADGDLGHATIEWESGDEIGRMATSFNRMLTTQRELVRQLFDTAESLGSASNDLIATAQEQEQGAREQSTTVEEVSSSMRSLSETARDIAQNADRLSSIAEEVSSNATEGQSALEIASTSIEQIVKQNETISERINALYEKSQAIITVVDIIDDISDRLDLLALNAALEGSRVGEAGKGFSLVAQEMRRLAENVSGSTKQIKGTIDEIHRFVQGSLEASQEGIATTREGAAEIEKMSSAIAKIFSLIGASTEATRSITIITQQQQTGTEQMVGAMSEVASVSNQNLTSAQGVTEAAADMTNLAARLREQIRAYRIDDSEAPQQLQAG